MPPRIVTVWCPDWPTVAAGIHPDRPAAVFRANRVVARTPAAAAAGVAVGERRRAAQGACPELEVLVHDPDRDARAFEPVVRAVAEMAPRLEIVEPGWLGFAARGPSRYFGGDLAMARQLVTCVRDVSGSAVSVGVADGRSPSAIAARRAARRDDGVMVVPPGGSADYVSGLTIAWLRELGEISPELADLFARLGLRTLGQLAALDAGDVLARFGTEGWHAHRLATGDDDRPPTATDPPPEWWVEHPFPEPVDRLETVVFVAKRLADELTLQLAESGRVCVRLVVAVETEHGERSERAWYRDQGLSATAIVERVRWQLEGWVDQPAGPSGGVALIRLVPDEVRSDDGSQAGLWGGRSRADEDATRAVVRLSGIAGDDAVQVPMWVGGRLPADRYRWVPAASADLEHTGDRLDRRVGPWPGSLPSPAPAVVPPEPVPAEVFDGVGRPVMVTGRGEVSDAPSALVVGATRRQVTAWAGPWTIEQRWWSSERSRRVACLQLVVESGVAHLVGVEGGRWAVLATYS